MKTMLVINDDPFALRLIKEMAEVTGHEVVTARDGKRGAAIAYKTNPNMVLISPERSSCHHETMEALRPFLERSGVPVVALTDAWISEQQIANQEHVFADAGLP